MHPVQFIPDSTLIEDVMVQMQRRHHNLAIVIDEYGGTAGMIAFEDLVEEIIGEFQDERMAAIFQLQTVVAGEPGLSKIPPTYKCCDRSLCTSPVSADAKLQRHGASLIQRTRGYRD